MSPVKEQMTEIIARQPDSSSFEDILRELAYARMIERGLADSDAGRTISDEEVREKIEAWFRTAADDELRDANAAQIESAMKAGWNDSRLDDYNEYDTHHTDGH